MRKLSQANLAVLKRLVRILREGLTAWGQMEIN